MDSPRSSNQGRKPKPSPSRKRLERGPAAFGSGPGPGVTGAAGVSWPASKFGASPRDVGPSTAGDASEPGAGSRPGAGPLRNMLQARMAAATILDRRADEPIRPPRKG